MFQRSVSTVGSSPVIGLMFQVINVLGIIVAFTASMVILSHLYLRFPQSVADTFIDRAREIIE